MSCGTSIGRDQGYQPISQSCVRHAHGCCRALALLAPQGTKPDVERARATRSARRIVFKHNGHFSRCSPPWRAITSGAPSRPCPQADVELARAPGGFLVVMRACRLIKAKIDLARPIATLRRAGSPPGGAAAPTQRSSGRLCSFAVPKSSTDVLNRAQQRSRSFPPAPRGPCRCPNRAAARRFQRPTRDRSHFVERTGPCPRSARGGVSLRWPWGGRMALPRPPSPCAAARG